MVLKVFNNIIKSIYREGLVVAHVVSMVFHVLLILFGGVLHELPGVAGSKPAGKEVGNEEKGAGGDITVVEGPDKKKDHETANPRGGAHNGELGGERAVGEVQESQVQGVEAQAGSGQTLMPEAAGMTANVSDRTTGSAGCFTSSFTSTSLSHVCI